MPAGGREDGAGAPGAILGAGREPARRGGAAPGRERGAADSRRPGGPPRPRKAAQGPGPSPALSCWSTRMGGLGGNPEWEIPARAATRCAAGLLAAGAGNPTLPDRELAARAAARAPWPEPGARAAAARRAARRAPAVSRPCNGAGSLAPRRLAASGREGAAQGYWRRECPPVDAGTSRAATRRQSVRRLFGERRVAPRLSTQPARLIGPPAICAGRRGGRATGSGRAPDSRPQSPPAGGSGGLVLLAGLLDAEARGGDEDAPDEAQGRQACRAVESSGRRRAPSPCRRPRPAGV